MSWFDARGGRLRFRGRVTKGPVTDWLASREGAQSLEAAARGIRFSLIGRGRSASRRMGRELHAAIGTPAVASILAAGCERYLKGWTDLAYAPSLPRATVALRRLVVVPRTLILGRTLAPIAVQLAACPSIAPLPEGFKMFLARWILDDMSRAIQRAEPSPERPVHARDAWACVGIDSDFAWIDRMWAGADWRGHALMFEMPESGLRRRERHELRAAIERIRAALPGLSRQQRDNLLRLAVDGMAQLTV